MFRGIFSQIIVIALGVAIIALYIEPLLGDIGKTQDETAQYRAEKEKVQSVNAKLAGLDQLINSIPPTERDSVETFLPDTDVIDTIAIPRDLEFIMIESGVIFEQVKMQEVGNDRAASAEQVENQPWVQSHKIDVSFTGSYEEVKTFLDLLPTNEYPLTVTELQIAPPAGDDVLQASGVLTTYSYYDDQAQ